MLEVHSVEDSDLYATLIYNVSAASEKVNCGLKSLPCFSNVIVIHLFGQRGKGPEYHIRRYVVTLMSLMSRNREVFGPS